MAYKSILVLLASFSLNFAHVVASEKVGYVYYSDGSLSAPVEKAEGKIAVGVVAYEYFHGDSALILSMSNLTDFYVWGAQSLNSGIAKIDNQEDASNDTLGFSNSLIIAANDNDDFTSAAKAALSYTAYDGDKGWYLPSIGEWIKIICALGDSKAGGNFEVFISNEEGCDVLSTINTALDDAGASLLSGRYWSSSLNIDSKNGMYADFEPKSEFHVSVFKESKTSMFKVRPIKRVAITSAEEGVVTSKSNTFAAESKPVVYSLSGVRLKAEPAGTLFIKNGKLGMRK